MLLPLFDALQLCLATGLLAMIALAVIGHRRRALGTWLVRGAAALAVVLPLCFVAFCMLLSPLYDYDLQAATWEDYTAQTAWKRRTPVLPAQVSDIRVHHTLPWWIARYRYEERGMREFLAQAQGWGLKQVTGADPQTVIDQIPHPPPFAVGSGYDALYATRAASNGARLFVALNQQTHTALAWCNRW